VYVFVRHGCACTEYVFTASGRKLPEAFELAD
jgi:hypothetical protein